MRPNTTCTAAALLAAAIAGASPASFAQAPGSPLTQSRQGMAMPGGMAMPNGASTTAGHEEMMAAMEKMNQAMMARTAMTGDPDHDFVAMMMPHHQGAIDMARIYLRDGKDPTIRRMAQKIVTDQEREIREFQAWEAKHPAPAR